MSSKIHFIGSEKAVQVSEDFDGVKVAMRDAELGFITLTSIHGSEVLVKPESIAYIDAGPGEPLIG